MTDIEQYLEETNTVLLMKESFERLKEKANALDKIKAEIEKAASRYTISRERDGMGQVEWSDWLIQKDEVLEIIDKYRIEGDDIV